MKCEHCIMRVQGWNKGFCLKKDVETSEENCSKYVEGEPTLEEEWELSELWGNENKKESKNE